MHGNVWQWVADPYEVFYDGAPSDGSVRQSSNASRRVVRGGSFFSWPKHLRSANRYHYSTVDRQNDLGFHVARTLTP